jgi:hypothetical protein
MFLVVLRVAVALGSRLACAVTQVWALAGKISVEEQQQQFVGLLSVRGSISGIWLVS